MPATLAAGVVIVKRGICSLIDCVAGALFGLRLVNNVDLLLPDHVQELHIELLRVHYHILVITDVGAGTHHRDITLGVNWGVDGNLSLVEVLVRQFL